MQIDLARRRRPSHAPAPRARLPTRGPPTTQNAPAREPCSGSQHEPSPRSRRKSQRRSYHILVLPKASRKSLRARAARSKRASLWKSSGSAAMRPRRRRRHEALPHFKASSDPGGGKPQSQRELLHQNGGRRAADAKMHPARGSSSHLHHRGAGASRLDRPASSAAPSRPRSPSMPRAERLVELQIAAV